MPSPNALRQGATRHALSDAATERVKLKPRLTLERPMEALEVRTIFAPYYLWQISDAAEEIYAFAYNLSFPRMMRASFIRIVDELTDRAVIEAMIGPHSHKARPDLQLKYSEMIQDRHQWMVEHGYENLVKRYLPEEDYPKDGSRMIAEGRVLVELRNPRIIDGAPSTKKVRRKERYFDV